MSVQVTEEIEVEIVCTRPDCGFYWYVPEAEWDPEAPDAYVCPHCGDGEGEEALY